MTTFGGILRPVDDNKKAANGEVRSGGQRDADRILYSSSFRRLSGVTQVISPQDDYIYHDRLTHSLKVAQVAKMTARVINKTLDSGKQLVRLDPDIVYAAALAHDLGHPPFGHAAEKELQEVLSGTVARDGSAIIRAPILRDSFEGNAQTFRIVTRLAARKPGERLSFDGDEEIKIGLNLLWRTQAAILKYPWVKGEQPKHLSHLEGKWGVYDSEQVFLNRAREVAQSEGLWGVKADRSVEAELMDWCDDVAYAIHDTEDFFRAKLIPLNRLAMGFESEWDSITADLLPKIELTIKRLNLKWDQKEYEAVCERVWAWFPGREYRGDSVSREELHRFASRGIKYLTTDVSVKNGALHVPERCVMVAELLKKLTRHYVVDTADLILDQHGQRAVVRRLFFDLYALVCQARLDGNAGANHLLPPRLEEYCNDSTQAYMVVYGTDEAKLARATVDFICSLTDRQAAILSRRLSGEAAPKAVSWVNI